MNVYKHFAAGLRSITFRSEYLLVVRANLSSKLFHYVTYLDSVPYEEGRYHTYFGEVKKLVDSFVTFWTDTMDDAHKESQKLYYVMDKKILMFLVDNTIVIRGQLWEDFNKVFLPIETSEQQEIYNEVQHKYQIHMKNLYHMRIRARKLENNRLVAAFARAELYKSLSRTNEIFAYAHTYISMLLADHLAQIKGSLQDILQRIRSNIANLEEGAEAETNTLLHQIYDLEKELLLDHRESLSPRRSSLNTAEINSAISKIRTRIAACIDRSPITKLKEEEKYFDTRLKEFLQIEGTLIKSKAELEKLQRERTAYLSLTTTEPPNDNYTCWASMKESNQKRLDEVKKVLFEAAKSLLTFFCSKGPSRILSKDNTGPYYIDDFGHKVYQLDYGLRIYHVDCEGNMKEDPEEDRYYYDDNGRYVYENGEKVYRLLGCTSSYQLGEDSLLKKITADCGHSESLNPDCGVTNYDLKTMGVDKEMLPKTKHVDITGTLDPEATRYLWDAVGAILPDALYDVGTIQPKNPIHYLAHRLLAHKYGKSTAELKQKQKKSDAYRAKILQDRQDKKNSDCKTWKAKKGVWSRHKDADDSSERTYNLYNATKQFISSLTFNE